MTTLAVYKSLKSEDLVSMCNKVNLFGIALHTFDDCSCVNLMQAFIRCEKLIEEKSTVEVE